MTQFFGQSRCVHSDDNLPESRLSANLSCGCRNQGAGELVVLLLKQIPVCPVNASGSNTPRPRRHALLIRSRPGIARRRAAEGDLPHALDHGDDFFALLVWLLWVYNGFRNRRAAPEVFEVFSILSFVYCLITGTARTADCISSERRDGTLGLLFLTNLNSAEIIAGKLCSSALASVYALFATFPMLALPLLMAEFNLLADHTNALRRVVLAYIAIWCAIPDGGPNKAPTPQSGDEYVSETARRIQPRAWWFDNCIQLHCAGEKAMENVDVAGDRVRIEFNWDDLSGLPLASEATQLFQQYYWSGPSPGLVSFAQTAVNQAIIACALERFRIANGKYPETLEQLVTAYLDRIPNDIIRGQPMIYEQAHGRYVLRGVGPNGIDDRNKKQTSSMPPVSDDWLWSYGTNAPAAAR